MVCVRNVHFQLPKYSRKKDEDFFSLFYFLILPVIFLCLNLVLSPSCLSALFLFIKKWQYYVGVHKWRQTIFIMFFLIPSFSLHVLIAKKLICKTTEIFRAVNSNFPTFCSCKLKDIKLRTVWWNIYIYNNLSLHSDVMKHTVSFKRAMSFVDDPQYQYYKRCFWKHVKT